MLPLNDKQEYLPRLAEGYSWDYNLGHDGVVLSIIDTGWAPVWTETMLVSIDAEPDRIREVLLKKARQVANMARPWNLTHADKINSVLATLEPPEDTRTVEMLQTDLTDTRVALDARLTTISTELNENKKVLDSLYVDDTIMFGR